MSNTIGDTFTLSTIQGQSGTVLLDDDTTIQGNTSITGDLDVQGISVDFTGASPSDVLTFTGGLWQPSAPPSQPLPDVIAYYISSNYTLIPGNSFNVLWGNNPSFSTEIKRRGLNWNGAQGYITGIQNGSTYKIEITLTVATGTDFILETNTRTLCRFDVAGNETNSFTCSFTSASDGFIRTRGLAGVTLRAPTSASRSGCYIFVTEVL